jgi:hypothetical protein
VRACREKHVADDPPLQASDPNPRVVRGVDLRA